jgi:hypothetical protein
MIVNKTVNLRVFINSARTKTFQETQIKSKPQEKHYFSLAHIYILSKSKNENISANSVSDPILSFEHDDRVSANDDHPDLLLLSGLGELDGVVQDDVHERVEAAKETLNSASAVDLQVDLE